MISNYSLSLYMCNVVCVQLSPSFAALHFKRCDTDLYAVLCLIDHL